MRVRAVGRADDITIDGLDAFACRVLAVGEVVTIGRGAPCSIVVRQQGEGRGLGGRLSYRIVRAVDGACRIQHTGHLGTVAIDGQPVAPSGVPFEGIVWPPGTSARLSFDGRMLLELVLEADEPRESVLAPCAITLTAFDEEGGNGRAVTDDGTELSCGASSFVRRRRDPSWRPQVGTRYFLKVAKRVAGIGLRAVDVYASRYEAAMDAVAVVRERMPRRSLAEALAWLEARGRAPKRAACGASDDDVRALEARLGLALPPSYVTFLRRHHWLDGRGLHMLSIDASAPRGSIEAGRATLHAYVASTLALGSPETTPIGWAIGQNLLRSVPLYTIDDPLPRGRACVATADGRFATAAHDFLSDDHPWSAFDGDFETLALDALAAANDDDDDDDVARALPIEAPPATLAAPEWSVGDRFRRALDGSDEATLRRELLAFDLEAIGDDELGDVFPSPAHRRLAARAAAPRLDSATSFTVVLTTREADGFRTEAARALPAAEEARVVPPHVTLETRIRDGATSAPYHLGALAPGTIARATVIIGKRLDGTPGPVAGELLVYRADEARLAAVAKCRAILAALDVPLPEDDARLAALHRQASLEEGATTSLEEELVARALVARGALSRATLGSPIAIVAAALAVLGSEGLPCLFDARRAVREARDLDALFQYVLREIDLALATARDARRCIEVLLRGDAMPTHAILAPSEVSRLLESGVLSIPSAAPANGVPGRSLASVVEEPPLDVLERLGHRVVVLPSPAAGFASGGLVLDDRAFLCVPVAAKLVGGIDHLVLAVVARGDGSVWPILVDVIHARSSVRDPRLLLPGITAPRLAPGGLMHVCDGVHGWLHLHDIVWSPLETSWRWPSLP